MNDCTKVYRLLCATFPHTDGRTRIIACFSASFTMITIGTMVIEAPEMGAWSDSRKALCVGECRMLGRSSRRMIYRLVFEVEACESKIERQFVARVKNLWNFSDRLSYFTLSSYGSNNSAKLRM